MKGIPMTITLRRFALNLTATAGGLLVTSCLSSAIAIAIANADTDEWNIEPVVANTVSTGGMAPFDQSIVESGNFQLFDITTPSNPSYDIFGILSRDIDIFGIHNQDFLVTGGAGEFSTGSVIDETNFGSGIENVYIDSVGTAAGGGNTITDTLYTPLGDFNLPIMFDAAAITNPAEFAAAVNPADATNILTDLGALFDPGTWLS
jgi:hypothetical protein